MISIVIIRNLDVDFRYMIFSFLKFFFLMWSIFKVFTGFLTILFLSYVLFLFLTMRPVVS